MNKDRGCLPFHFLVSSAQGHLRKAKFLRESGVRDQELHFLKKFEVLVSTSIPSHRYYPEQTYEKNVVELQSHLDDVRQRIQELQFDDPAWVKTSSSRARRNVSNGSQSQLVETASASASAAGSKSLRLKIADGFMDYGPVVSSRRRKTNSPSEKDVDGSYESSVEEGCEPDSFPDSSELEAARRTRRKPPSKSFQEVKEFGRGDNGSRRASRREFDIDDVQDSSELETRRRSGKKAGKPAEEFRRGLKALEEQLISDKEKELLDYTRRKLEAYQHRKARRRHDAEVNDVEMIKEFVSSGHGFMTEEGRNENEKHDRRKRHHSRHRHRHPSEDARRERGSQHSSMVTDSRSWKQQVRSLVQENMDSVLPERLNQLVAMTEDALIDIRNEGSQAREDILRVDQVRESLREEQASLRQESGSMRIELQNAYEVGLQLKEQVQNMKGHNELLLMKLQNDLSGLKAQVENMAETRGEVQEVRKELDKVGRLSELYVSSLDEVKEEIASIKAASESRMESIVNEINNRGKKNESSMKKAIDAAAKLQEKYTVDLEKMKDSWNKAMNVQIEARESGSLGGQNVLLGRIQSIEEEVAKLAETVRPLSNGAGDISRHQELIERDLQRLSEQMREAKRKLDHTTDEQKTSTLTMEIDHLEEKMREASKSWSCLQDKILEVGKKIRKLEEEQSSLVASVEELHLKTSTLERSASDCVESVIQAVDARLEGAESAMKEVHEKRASEVSSAELLKDQIGHVSSRTMSKLRLLDSKLETYKTGVEQALAGASVAEKKCGVLGGEIVKVFRILAARKMIDNEASTVQDDTASKEKTQPSSCRTCTRAGSYKQQQKAMLLARKTRRESTAEKKPSFFECYAEACQGTLNRKLA